MAVHHSAKNLLKMPALCLVPICSELLWNSLLDSHKRKPSTFQSSSIVWVLKFVLLLLHCFSQYILMEISNNYSVFLIS